MYLIPTEAFPFLYSATYFILDSLSIALFNIFLKWVSFESKEFKKSLFELVSKH